MSGLLAFAAGLGTGMAKRQERNEELDRQDRLDMMRAQEHGLRMKALEGEIADREDERASRKELKSLASDATVTDGQAVGQNFYGPGNEAAANEAAEQEAFIQGKEVAPRAATGVTGAGRPRIAAAGVKASDLNSPDAKFERLAQWYETRDPEKALLFRARAQEFSEKRNALMLEKSFEQAAGMVRSGKFEDLAKVWYGGYKDGQDADFVPDGKGGGKFIFKKGDQVVGEHAFKSGDQLLMDLRDTMFPAERAKRLQAAEEERRKNAEKPTLVPYGAALVEGGKVKYKNDRLPTGAGGAGADGKPLTAGFDPYAGFDEKGAQEKVWNQINKDIENGVQLNERQQAERFNRLMSEARTLWAQTRQAAHNEAAMVRRLQSAQTPQELESAREEARRLQIPDWRLEQLDPRLKKSEQPTVKSSAAPKPPADTSVSGLDNRTLKRLAESPGHANQKAAMEELERRKSLPQPSVGPDAASALGGGA